MSIQQDTKKEKIIIDTDCGTDDALAILLAIGCDKFDVLGITCVAGNTTLEQVCSNVLRVLKVGRRENIPVFRGCSTSVLQYEYKSESRVHAADGFGGIANTIQVDETKIQAEHAVNWLAKTVEQNPGQITLITLGPLTNVLLANTMYPNFHHQLKHVFAMGGALNARGNVTMATEFNVYCDPEAAYVVLEKFTCPITLLTWDVCLESYLSWEWYQQKVLASNSMKANFVARLCDKRNEWSKNNPTVFKGFYACDLLAVACLADPQLVLEKIQRYATVELNGSLTRGQLLVDWRNFTKNPQKIDLVLKVDLERLARLYETNLLR